MMPTKIGSYGNMAGYGAAGHPGGKVNPISVRDQQIAGNAAAAVGKATGIWAGAAAPKRVGSIVMPGATALTLTGGRNLNKFVDTRTGQAAKLPPPPSQYRVTPPAGTSNTGASFDPRANLATGYSFATDDQMYNGVGGKTNGAPDGTAAVDAATMAQARPLWQYLLGTVIVGGGAYMAYKHFSKRVRA